MANIADPYENNMAESENKIKSNLQDVNTPLLTFKSDKSYTSRDLSLIPSKLNFAFIHNYA